MAVKLTVEFTDTAGRACTARVRDLSGCFSEIRDGVEEWDVHCRGLGRVATVDAPTGQIIARMISSLVGEYEEPLQPTAKEMATWIPKIRMMYDELPPAVAPFWEVSKLGELTAKYATFVFPKGQTVAYEKCATEEGAMQVAGAIERTIGRRLAVRMVLDR